jgi:hypothetical protein
MIFQLADIQIEADILFADCFTCSISHSYGASFDASVPRQNAPLRDHTLPNSSGRMNATLTSARAIMIDLWRESP